MQFSYKSQGKSDSWNEDWADTLKIGNDTIAFIADGQQSTSSFSSSKFAIGFIKDWISSHPYQSPAQLHYIISDAFLAAHKFFATLQGLTGKVFTASITVVVFLQNNEYLMYHVGNCALFRYRDGEFVRLNTEHNIAAGMLKKGEITAEEYQNHPQRAVLSRYLGMTEPGLYEVYRDTVLPNDRFVLLTDGIYRVFDENEIVEAIVQTDNPDEARDILVDVAGERQQFDDKTVCICWAN